MVKLEIIVEGQPVEAIHSLTKILNMSQNTYQPDQLPKNTTVSNVASWSDQLVSSLTDELFSPWSDELVNRFIEPFNKINVEIYNEFINRQTLSIHIDELTKALSLKNMDIYRFLSIQKRRLTLFNQTNNVHTDIPVTYNKKSKTLNIEQRFFDIYKQNTQQKAITPTTNKAKRTTKKDTTQQNNMRNDTTGKYISWNKYYIGMLMSSLNIDNQNILDNIYNTIIRHEGYKINTDELCLAININSSQLNKFFRAITAITDKLNKKNKVNLMPFIAVDQTDNIISMDYRFINQWHLQQ